MSKIQQHSITSCTSFAQKGGVEALKGDPSSILKMVDEFKKRREIVINKLNDIDGISCFKPKGAFYAFFKFDFKMTSEEFTNYVLEKARVVMTPGSAFGPGGESFVRMSYAASEEKLNKGLKKLEEVVKSI